MFCQIKFKSSLFLFSILKPLKMLLVTVTLNLPIVQYFQKLLCLSSNFTVSHKMQCSKHCIFQLFWSVRRTAEFLPIALYGTLLIMMPKIPLAFLGIHLTGWLIVHLESTKSSWVLRMRRCQIMTRLSLVLLVGFLYLSGRFYFMLMVQIHCFHQSRFLNSDSAQNYLIH
jgi:hypothetical protein